MLGMCCMTCVTNYGSMAVITCHAETRLLFLLVATLTISSKYGDNAMSCYASSGNCITSKSLCECNLHEDKYNTATK